MTRALITAVLFVLIFNISNAQNNTITGCFFNPTDTFILQIDSGSIWEIGTPTKAFQNGNYSGNHSIVTSLDSNYKNNDTSSFIIEFNIGGGNSHINELDSIEVIFTHKFQLQEGDYGEILTSFNHENWYPYYERFGSQNYFEAYDTTSNFLEITGFSAGWVQTRLLKSNTFWDGSNSFFGFLNMRMKFTLYSDSAINMEGWQIGDICVVYHHQPLYWGISELQENSSFQIAPNPANGNFSIKRESSQEEQFTIFNNLGQIVKEGELLESEETIPLNLIPGIYFVRVSDGNSLSSQKLIVR